MIITITDLRRAGYCPGGIRRWFEDQGFDFREFLTNGIPVEVFLSTRDGQAEEAVRRIREQRRG